MKNTILKLILSLLLLCFLCTSASAIVNHHVPVRLLYAQPDKNSGVVFEIPIEVALLSMTEDLNWFRVKIRFSVGFIHYEHYGWVNIPVGSTFNIPPLAPVNIP